MFLIDRKNQNGITLISLIATIIILIILAGTSVNILMGEDGIIKKAVEARKNTTVALEKESISIAYTTLIEEEMESGEIITTEKFENELKKLNKESTVSKDSQENFIVEIKETKNKYKVEKNGNITKIEENEENVKRAYVKNIEFNAGEDLEELGFEDFCTDTASLNDARNVFKSFDGYTIAGAWANGYGYIISTEKYDFSKIDKVEVGVFYGANSTNCINTFTIGLCSTNENNDKFDENLKTSIEKTGLTTGYKKNISEEKIETVQLDTSNVSNKYYLKLCENHGPTPASMTTEARIFWIKLYYNDYREKIVTEKFTYTGNYQEYVVPETGKYKIECYGARGGCDNWSGTYLSDYGLGGYASGTIELTKGEKLYIYVGQTGADGITQANQLTSTSFNGGGAGIGSSDNDDGGGAGGGATDVRLIAGNWNDFESLKSRIIVAGGGSGGATVASGFSKPSGGSGGGLTGKGSIWKYSNAEVTNHTYNATQTTGYKFGIGQNAITKGNAGGAGAGGGYYGGYTSIDSPAGGAGGGSGYVSGYAGCNSISKESTEDNITHTGSSIHYSGKVFTNIELKDSVNSKEGYVRIVKQ